MELHGTTILCVRKGNKVVIGGDGQVSMGNQILKSTANKIRKIGDSILAGFAGSTADAVSMFELLENRVSKSQERLEKVCTHLAKMWRTGRAHKMDALLIVADPTITLVVTGNGDVVQPEHNAIGIGSGGSFARAAARALLDIDGLDAHAIVDKSMRIAADECVFTNHNLVKLELDCNN